MNYKQLINAFIKIIQIRTVENLIAKDFMDRKIFSFLHLCAGQEAAAVGVCAALSPQDDMVGNHRSHGHYLAKGGNFEKMIHEVYGSTEGCCAGYGGSMHMLDRSVNFQGSTPILGSVVPITSGIAFAKAHKVDGGVAVGFLGDGAAEEGGFYETINLAGVLRLPLMLVIEDNRYAVSSDKDARKAPGYDLKGIVEGIGGYYLRADGQDVVAVYKACTALRQMILNSPSKCGVLHLDVLREYAHSGPIKDENSRKGDTASFRESRDPIAISRLQLVEMGKGEDLLDSIFQETTFETTETFKSIIAKIKVRQL